MQPGRRGGMVDARDLKSLGGKPPCRFESCRRHQYLAHFLGGGIFGKITIWQRSWQLPHDPRITKTPPGMNRTGPSFANLLSQNSAMTGPDTGSVTPSPPPRSSSMSRKLSRRDIIAGREAAMLSKSSHSPMKQKVRSPVLNKRALAKALHRNGRAVGFDESLFLPRLDAIPDCIIRRHCHLPSTAKTTIIAQKRDSPARHEPDGAPPLHRPWSIHRATSHRCRRFP
jgi:hypothetical protein